MSDVLLSQLRQAVGDDAVLTDQRAREFHRADALHPSRARNAPEARWGLPAAVILPTTAQEVSRVLSLASQHRRPVVPYGGGTGVMGAAVPPADAIVVDLQRMNRVRSISVEDRTAWAEAGTVLKDLDGALSRRGLMLGHDPWSLPVATVGGAISTDGVGYRAARYGSMGAQVLGLEVVLPTGELLTTKSVSKKASGPDLNGLFIGSEGALGIITAAALRVFRLPEERRFATVFFPSFEDGFRAVAEMFAIGLRPALTDLTEEPDDEQVRTRVLLYLAFEGFREEAQAQETRALKVCQGFAGEDIGPAETEEYWRDRHQSGERYRREALPLLPAERWARGPWAGRGWDYLHVALPVSRVLEFRRQAEAVCQAAGISIREYAIWTDPELFSMMVTDARVEASAGSEAGFAQAVNQVLRLAQDMGGVMEYCHGTGLKLAHLADREWGSGLEVVRRIKRVLDPHGIMNPGRLGL